MRDVKGCDGCQRELKPHTSFGTPPQNEGILGVITVELLKILPGLVATEAGELRYEKICREACLEVVSNGAETGMGSINDHIQQRDEKFTGGQSVRSQRKGK